MGRPKSPRRQHSKRPTPPRQPPHHKSSRHTRPRTRNRRRRRALNPVNLRRQNKIALRQSINLMRPRGNFRLPPPQKNIRVMPLVLRNRPHLVHKRERLLKIRKRERPHNMMPIHYLPLRHFLRQPLQLFSSQRRPPPPTRPPIFLASSLIIRALQKSPSSQFYKNHSSRDIPRQAHTKKCRNSIAPTDSAILLRDKSQAAPAATRGNSISCEDHPCPMKSAN